MTYIWLRAEGLVDASNLCRLEDLDEYVLVDLYVVARVTVGGYGEGEEGVLVALGEAECDTICIVGGTEGTEEGIWRDLEVDLVLKVGLDAIVLEERVLEMEEGNGSSFRGLATCAWLLLGLRW